MDPKQNQKPLTIKSLTRTPIGSVFVNDLKDIFSALLCKLNLKDLPPLKKPSIIKLPIISKKKYPYCFTIKNAIEVMENLSIDIKHGSTLTKISYETKPKFAFELIQIFFSSKLLHCPDDKTMDKLNSSCSQNFLLQPTPKGVAILHWFCQRVGISQMMNCNLPDILNSKFNSMELITFERDSRSDLIIHNEYWDKLLFLQIMGSKLNIWSTNSPPDEIKLLGDYFNKEDSNNGVKNMLNPSLALTNEDTFFEYLRNRQNELIEKESKLNSLSNNDSNNNNNNKNQQQQQSSPNSNKYNQIKANNKNHEISPFYHKFFTNPDSDSHVQYYTSKNGLRFFKSKSIFVNNKKVQIDNCFSGKAIVQYLMDCTDLMYQIEAIKVASFFLKYELIKSISNSNEFKPSKDSIYILTEKGLDLVKWDNHIKMKISPSENVGQSDSELIKNLEESELESESQSESESEDEEDEFGIPKQIDFSKIDQNSVGLSLNQILQDPGLKYLLRQFMITNLCVENLNAYDDIIEFQRRMNVLKKLLSLKDKAKEKYLKRAEVQELIQDEIDSKKILITFRAAIKRLSEVSLIKVYNIYAIYLSDNAPNELNIDSNLKSSVQKLITDEANMNLIQSSTSLLFKDSDLIDLKQSSFPIGGGKWKNKINEEDDGDVFINPTIREIPKNDEINNSKLQQPPVLTLNLRNNHFKKNSPSPTDIVLGPTLKFLNDVNVHYDQIKSKAVKMMETDSLNKFLISKEFNVLKVSLPNNK